MGRVSEYAYISANLRAKMSRILQPEFLLKCAEVKDLETLLMNFKDTDFAFLQEVYHRTADIKTCEKEVLDSEIAYNGYLFKYTKGPVRNFCEALAIRYEADILKDVLRLWFDRVVRRRSINRYTPYLHRERIVHQLPLDPILNAENVDTVLQLLSTTPYGRVLSPVLHIVEEQQTLYPVENAIDEYVYQQMMQSALALSKRDREIAEDYTALLIDIENLNRIVRLKHYFNFNSKQIRHQLLNGGRRLPISESTLPDGFEEEIPQIVKKYFRDLIKDQLKTETSQFDQLLFVESVSREMREKQAQRALCGNPFSIGIIIAFFIRKRQEIQRVMTLLNAKYYQLGKERIKELL